MLSKTLDCTLYRRSRYSQHTSLPRSLTFVAPLPPSSVSTVTIAGLFSPSPPLLSPSPAPPVLLRSPLNFDGCCCVFQTDDLCLLLRFPDPRHFVSCFDGGFCQIGSLPPPLRTYIVVH